MSFFSVVVAVVVAVVVVIVVVVLVAMRYVCVLQHHSQWLCPCTNWQVVQDEWSFHF